MGNSEGKSTGRKRRRLDPPASTDRPLPPLPTEEEDVQAPEEADPDTPPPYPPPPPPGEERSTKRYSWKFSKGDSSIFGQNENKRRSWLLNFSPGIDSTKSKVAKDGKDVEGSHTINVNSSVGLMDNNKAGVPGVRVVADSGELNNTTGSWKVDTHSETNKTVRSETHTYTYNISSNDMTNVLPEGVQQPPWELHDGKLISIRKDYVKGEDSDAPGYSLLHECVQTDARFNSQYTGNCKDTSLPTLDVSGTSDLSDELKNVIDELRGKSSLEGPTSLNVTESKNFVTITPAHKDYKPSVNNDSLSKLEAELSALLSPELAVHGNAGKTHIDDSNMVGRFSLPNGNGIESGNVDSNEGSGHVSQTYNVDISPNLPLPDIQDFSGRDVPYLPDLLKGNHRLEMGIKGPTVNDNSFHNGVNFDTGGNISYENNGDSSNAELKTNAKGYESLQGKFGNSFDIHEAFGITGNVNSPGCKKDMDVSIPNVNLRGETPNLNVKPVFLKSQSPEVAGTYNPGKYEMKNDDFDVSVSYGKQKDVKFAGDLETGKVDLKEIKASKKDKTSAASASIDVNSDMSDRKMKASKPKAKLGSCFGKPTPEVEGDLEHGELKIDRPAVSAEAGLEKPSEEFKANVDVPDVKTERSPKSKFGSCFGKPKSTEVEDKYQPGKLETERPEVSPKAGISGNLDVGVPVQKVESGRAKSKFPSCFSKPKEPKLGAEPTSMQDVEPKVSGEIEGTYETPEVNVKAEKPKVESKVKLGSCFGKSKSPKIEGTGQLPDLETDQPEILGIHGYADTKPDDVSIIPSGSVIIDTDTNIKNTEVGIESPEVNVKAESTHKMPKIGFGSFLGKSKAPKVELQSQVSNVEIDQPIVAADINVDHPKIAVNPSVSVEAPMLPEFEKNLSIDANFPKSEPAIRIAGNQPDIPKVEAEVGGKANVPDIEIAVKTPKFPKVEGELDIGEITPEIRVPGREVDLKIPELPKTGINVDLEGKLPSLSENFKGQIPGDEVEIDLPSMETEIKADLPSKPKVKLPKAQIEGKAPEVKVSLPSGKAEANLRKDKLGPCSCAGKSGKMNKEEPYLPNVSTPSAGAEIDIEAHKSEDIKVERPEASAKASISLPSADVSAEMDTSDTYKKKKPKSKLGSCFGKPKSAEFEGRAGEIKIQGSEVSPKASLSTSNVGIDTDIITPEVQIKNQKPKGEMNLGSCFGKPKKPTIDEASVTATVDPGEVKCSTKVGEIESIGATVDSPEVKVKSHKPKAKFGSCFGKSETQEVEGKLGTAKIEIEGGESSGEPNIPVPSARINVSSDAPEMEVKTSKAKSKLGSCFGKPKAPKVEGEYKAGEMEVERPELSAKMSTNLDEGDTSVNVNTPIMKADSNKPKVKLGSCFGKPKDTKVEGDYEPKKVEIEGMEASGKASVSGPSISSVEPNVTVKASKPKAKLGSCFGKPESPKIECEYDSGRLDVEAPESSTKASVEARNDVDVEAAVPEVKIKSNEPKGKLGSCFGKPKTPELRGEYKPAKIDIEGPVAQSGASVSLPSASGSVSVDTPDVKKTKTKSKFPSCFGKSKEPKLEAEVKSVEVGKDIPEMSASIEGGAERPEVNIKTENKHTKPKIGFGSCFGKGKAPKVEVEGRMPNVEIDQPTVTADIDVEPPKLTVNPSVSVEVPKLPELEKNVSIEANLPEVGPSVKLSGDLPDIPKVEAEVGGKANIPDIEIAAKTPELPKIEGKIDIGKVTPEIIVPEGQVDLNIPELPKSDISVDLEGKPPALSGDVKGAKLQIPEGEVVLDIPSVEVPEINVDLPSKPKVTIPEAKIEAKSPELEVSLPSGKSDVKVKKGKLGPCVCAGKSGKMDKGEPYLPSVSAPSPGAEIDIEAPEGKIKSNKGKAKLGSCFGNTEGTEMKGEYKSKDIEVEMPEASAEASVSLPSADVGAELDTSEYTPTKRKPKSKLGSCFGKPKGSELEGGYKPGEMKIEQPEVSATASVSPPSVGIDADIGTPETQVKSQKPKGKLNLGSCFGKPKEPVIEGEPLAATVEPGEVKASAKVGEITASAGTAETSVASPDIKVKGHKPKSKFGSCFGKPKSPAVESKLEPAKVEIEGGEGSGEASIHVPSASVEVGNDVPEVKVKASKPKANLGSCFGKPKTPNVEGEYKPREIEVESPEASAKASIKLDEGEGEVSAGLPAMKADSSKPKVKLGSCFGKPKDSKVEGEFEPKKVEVEGIKASGQAEVSAPSVSSDAPKVTVKASKPKAKLGSCFGKPKSPKIEGEHVSGRLDIDRPEVSAEASVKAESGVDVGADVPELKIKTKEPKGKVGSCFGKPKSSELEGEYKPAKIEVEGPAAQSEASVTIPSGSGSVSIDTPDIKKIKTKSKFPSCFGKSKEPKLEAEVKSVEVGKDIPEMSASIEGGAEKPEVNIKAENKHTKPKIGFGSCFGKGKTPKIEVEGRMPIVEIDQPTVTADIDVEPPKLAVNPSVSVEVPKLPELEKNVSIETNLPEVGPSVKLSGDIPDIPKVEAEVGGKANIPDIEITAKTPELPKIEGKIDIGELAPEITVPEGQVDLNIPELPKPDINVDLEGKVPSLSGDVKGAELQIPEGEVVLDLPSMKAPEINVDLPSTPKVTIPEAKIEAKSPELEVSLPSGKADVKAKKGKLGPCACAGKSGKMNKEEPYLPSISTPSSGAEIDIKTPEGKIKSNKGKAKLGSCFGKPESTKIKGEYKSKDIEVEMPEASAEASVSLPSADVGAELDTSEFAPTKRKPKSKLGSCFGKSKGSKLEGEYKPGEMKIEQPEVSAEASISPPSVGIDADVNTPEIQVKSQKPKGKMNLGSCFGKPKKPAIEGEPVAATVEPGEVKASAKVGEITASAGTAETSVASPDIKVKGHKPKSKFGSCFGKPKSPAVEGKLEPAKVEIKGGEGSGEGSLDAPSAIVEVGTDVPEVKVKANKPKAKLGSCFGKPKTPDVEGEYKPREIEVESPEASAKASIKLDEGEGEVGAGLPAMKAGSNKPKVKLGSCFGKPKDSKIEGEFEAKKVEVEGIEASGQATVSAPSVSSVAPKVTVKANKPKAKLASCFGKPKSPKIEGELDSGRLDIDRPEVSAEASVKAESGVDVGADVPELKIKTKEPKGKLGSCFGKPKSSELEGEYKPAKIEVEGPAAHSEASVTIPSGSGSVSIDTPDIKKTKTKSKFPSCFGKSKEPKLEAEVKSVEVGKDIPEMSASIEGGAERPEVNIKAENKHTKPKIGFGSCFGKGKTPKIEVEGRMPTVKIDQPTVAADIDVEPPKLAVNPSVRVEVPKLPELEKNVSIEANLPEVGPSVKLSGDIPDIPKVEAEVGSNANIPDIEISAKTPELPKIEGKIDIGELAPEITVPEGQVDLNIPELPKSDINVDLEGKVPSLSGDVKGAELQIPEGEVVLDLPSMKAPEINVDLPSTPKVAIPEAKIEAKSPELEVSLPSGKVDVKAKKGKLGPCACAGKSGKLNKEEPYLPSVSTPSSGAEIDIKAPEGKIKSNKGKAKLGSCFGKPESTKIKGEYKSKDIKVEMPEASAEASVRLPSAEVGAELDTPEFAPTKRKPKSKLGSCFGKSKGSKLEGEYKPGEMKIEQPEVSAEASISPPSVGIDADTDTPEIQVKSQKPKGKMNLGSCFGKPKKPVIEGEPLAATVEPEEVKVSAKVGEITASAGTAEASVASPDIKVKGHKPKSKFGSCFGKPKSPAVEGKLEPAKVEIEGGEGSGEASIHVPGASVEVGTDVPEVKVKASKPKAKLGSCFGKPKTPDVEGDYKPREIEVESPEASAKASIKLDGEGEVSAGLPAMKSGNSKPKVKLGSCFGKPKDSKVDGEFEPKKVEVEGIEASGKATVSAPSVSSDVPKVTVKASKPKAKLGSCFGKPKSPKIEGELDSGRLDIDRPEVSAEASVKAESGVDVGADVPELKIKTKEPKGKLGSCFGKPKSSELEGEYKPAEIEVEGPAAQSEASVTIPSGSGSVSIDTPDVKKTKTKSKFPSCFGKSKEPKLEAEVKSMEVGKDIPEMSASIEGGAERPEVNIKAENKHTKPKIGFGSCFGKGKTPKIEVEGRMPTVKIDQPTVAADIDVEPPKLAVNPSVRVEVPKLPELEKNVSIEANLPEVGPSVKLSGDIPDIPKVEAEVGGNANIPDIEISAKTPELPKIEGKIDIGELAPEITVPEGQVDLNIPELPKSDINVDLEGKVPSLSGDVKGAELQIPEGEVVLDLPSMKAPEINVDLPSTPKVAIPETKIEAKSPELEVSLPSGKIDVKAKKGKLGPCACAGKSGKMNKEEPYLPSVSTPSSGAEIDIKAPEGKIKSNKGKAKLGSCFGKPESTKIKGEYKSKDIKVEMPEASAEASVRLPSAEVGAELDTPEFAPTKRKPKSKLGSCFGKSKGSKLEGEYKPGEMKIEQPEVSAEASISPPSVGIDADTDTPEIQVKSQKPKGKMNLGSCFGKPKKPVIEGEPLAATVEPEEVKVSAKVGEITASAGTAEASVASPDIEVKGHKPKSKFGSCFGKPKSPAVEGKLEPAKVEIEGGEGSGEASIHVPGASVEVGTDVPEVKVKASKPKAKLGSCFGKPKTPDVEGDYKPREIEVESPEASAKASIKLDGEGEVSAGLPAMKSGNSKPKVKLGSCFGKPKDSKVEGEFEPKKVEVEGIEASGKATVSAPSVSSDVPKVTVKASKPKAKLGSCFGKPKSPKMEGELDSGRLDIDRPEVSAEASVKAESGVDVGADVPELKIKTKEQKGKLGSCFGKPKSSELEGEYKPAKIEVEGPAAQSEASVTIPSGGGIVSIDTPDVKKTKTKSKFPSCFGKSKEPKLEAEVKSVEVGKDIPEMSASIEGGAEKPEVNIKAENKHTKPKIGFGSCFGKGKTPKIEVEGRMPSVEIDQPTVTADIDVETPKLTVNPSVSVEVPKLPELEKNVSIEANLPEVGPSVKLSGDLPDIPKVEAEVGGKANIPDIEISAKTPELPKIEGKIDIGDLAPEITVPEGQVDLNIPELPKSDINVDIEGKVPSLSGDVKGAELQIPEGEVVLDLPSMKAPEINVDLPSMPKVAIPEAKIEAKSPELEVSLPSGKVDVKAKKGKLGPCACAGKSGKLNKEEPYLPSVSTPSSGAEIDIKAPEGKIKSNKGKAKLGSCFGKPESTKIKGEYKSKDIEVEMPEASAEPSVSLPSADVGAELDTSEFTPTKRKPKSKLGSCFGKSKGAKLEGEYKPGEMKIEQPEVSAEASISPPSVAIDADVNTPEIQVKSQKPKGKMNLGSCFGKPKRLVIEGEPLAATVEPGEVKASAKAGKITASAGTAETSVASPDIKVKGHKPKSKFGSCFGKPESPAVESKLEPAKVEIEGGEGSDEASIHVPSGSVEVGTDVPEVKVKASKPKAKLGSCFSKPKTPDVEGEYKPREIEVESPEASAKASIKLDEGEGEVGAGLPAMKAGSSKPKVKLGSCFGKPKDSKVEGEFEAKKVEVEGIEASGQATVSAPSVSSDAPKVTVKASKPKTKLGSCFGEPKSPKIEGEHDSGRFDIDRPDVSVEASVKAESGVDVGADVPELKIKTTEPKGKVGSCFGKPKRSELEVEGPAAQPEASVTLPSASGSVSIDTSDIKKTKAKSKFPSCFRS